MYLLCISFGRSGKKGHMQNYNVSCLCVCVCVCVYADVWPFEFDIAGNNNRALSAKQAIIIKSKAHLKCHRNKIPYRIAFGSWFCRCWGAAAFSIRNMPLPHHPNKIEPHFSFLCCRFLFFFSHAQNKESRFMYMLFYRTLKKTAHTYPQIHTHTCILYMYRPRHTYYHYKY